MMKSLFASFRESRFSRPETSARRPTSCPYCPGTAGCHWTKAATYPRYGQGSERIRVQRYKCKIKERTFSILPDALLPHQGRTTATILGWLDHMVVQGHGTASSAGFFDAPRSTLRRVRSKFVASVKVLRLPGYSGALAPGAFLRRLALLGLDGVAALFAEWKQREPKHSLVGMYPR